MRHAQPVENNRRETLPSRLGTPHNHNIPLTTKRKGSASLLAQSSEAEPDYSKPAMAVLPTLGDMLTKYSLHHLV